MTTEPDSGVRSTFSLLRWLVTILGALGTCAGIAGIAAYYSPLVSSTASRLAAFTPVLIACGVLGLVLLGAARRAIGALIAGVVVAVGLFTQAPLYAGSVSAADGDIVVMQANIYLGQADIADLARTVKREGVDILTVVELTEQALAEIKESELVAALPYSFTEALDGGRGVGVFSRYELTGGAALEHFRLGNIRVEATIPDRGRYAVYALHPLPPWPEPAWRWNAELDRIAELLSAERLPTIAGSDMNSTWDHRQFRELLAGSSASNSPQLIDAAERTGAGWAPTYPANQAIPPLLAIDHILTRNGLTPTSFRTVDLPGSDHRGVLATVR